MEKQAARSMEIDTSQSGPDGVRVTVGGEIDLSTLDQLRRALLSAVEPGSPTVLRLDLSSVNFLDCGGLGTLISIRQHAAQSGTRVAITAASPMVDRLLSLCDVAAIFDYPTRAPGPPTSNSRQRWRWPTALRRHPVE
jgi:anti-anti-sigma factor